MGDVVPLEKYVPKRNLPAVIDVPERRDEQRVYQAARLALEMMVCGCVAVVVVVVAGLFIAFVGAMFALAWHNIHTWMLWLLLVPFVSGAALYFSFHRPRKSVPKTPTLRSATIVPLSGVQNGGDSNDPKPAA